MIRKKDFLWNMIGSIVQSLFSVIASIVITRINGIDEAGIFNITYATAFILYAIGDYGMRVYHVTDTKRESSFQTYLLARIFVNVIMVLVGIGVINVIGYSSHKAFMCFSIIIFKFVDGISETFQGEFQLSGRLDLGGKSVSIRMTVSLAGLAITDIITKNILLSFIVFDVINIISFILFDLINIRQFIEKRRADIKDACMLLIKCFPVFYSTLLNLYVINSPKYAIDRWLSNEEQGYFSIINLPTFTINLMSIFALKPLLKPIGDYFNNKEYRKLNEVVIKMALIIAGLTILVEAACMIIGIPVLELVYNEKLGGYKQDMFLLIISGGFNALTVMFFNVITAMRCKIEPIAAYTVTTIFALFVSDMLVKSKGLTGAGLSSVAVMFVLFATLLLMYLYKMHRYVSSEIAEQGKAG